MNHLLNLRKEQESSKNNPNVIKMYDYEEKNYQKQQNRF